MKTPPQYIKNLKNKIITEEMLINCLYSSNKRAKNHRDKASEYRDYFRSNRFAYDKYSNIEKFNLKKEEYYRQKDVLLSIVQPTCIHKEHFGYEKRRIYDFESNYRKKKKKFIWENCFFDEKEKKEVQFGDILNYSKPIYHYYLFYDLNGTKTFHSPINESEIEDYDLDIVDIDLNQTEGHEIDKLISNQFVKKVISLIKSGEYTYIPGKQIEQSNE